MHTQVLTLKTEIQHLRSLKGPKSKIPTGFWDRLQKLSQTTPLRSLCKDIGIDYYNARLKVRKITQEETFSLPPMIELSKGASPVMEVTLKSGTVIKVFEQ